MNPVTRTPEYRLNDELARCCLPSSRRDPQRILAWVNSVCILFLAIGILGARRGSVSLRTPPPVAEVVSVVVEPVTLPPPTPSEQQPQEPEEREKPETPQVVVVIPDSPAVNFAVPTIGNLVAPSALAQPPPLHPLQPPAALQNIPAALRDTGAGGERPRPPYPRIALEQAQEGSVTLLLSADQAGNILSVEVKTSSGYPVLDRGALDYVKRHWKVPRGGGSRWFEATITYQLQAN
jgi:protein TonB